MTAFRPVSVVICTRNRAHRLTKIVNLLRVQDYPQDAMEIIVVDHHSSDGTAAVVDRLASEPGRFVRYVFESHEGITFARNRGAEEARYPYVAYIDDDCSVRSDWLRTLMSGFELDARVAAVGGLVVVKWEAGRPRWVRSEMETWWADTSYLGSHSRLLGDDERVVESNTAFDRRAWEAAGGFVGMEQFGSQNMAAGEVLYLLHQIRRQGGKIAFVPEAVMYHHVSTASRRRILRRAYWQGVSDAILDALLHKPSWSSTAVHLGRDVAALTFLLGAATASCLAKDARGTMFQLTRATWRFGFLLSQMHIVGNWPRVRSWRTLTRPGSEPGHDRPTQRHSASSERSA